MSKWKNRIHLVLVSLWTFEHTLPHFGLTCLAAYLREKLPEVEVSIVEGLNSFEEILEKKPEIIGFTSDTLTFNKTVETAENLKRKLGVPIILGGVHITAWPESLPAVFDIGVIGEGEISTYEILKLFSRNYDFPVKKLRAINGLVFKSRGKLIQTAPQPLISDIDLLPFPARDLTPMNEFYLKKQLNLFGVKRLAAIMTTRGCPYRCIFCGSPVHWKKARFHSAEYVIAEIKYLVDFYRIDGLMFWDDLFILPRGRLKKMADLIETEGLNRRLTFFGYARANLIDDETCRILQKMNVKRLIFGFESGSEKILGQLKRKSVTISDNRRTIRLCRKYSLTTSSGYIVGTPGETISDLRQTRRFMTKYPLDNTQVYLLTPYPGTEIWQIAENLKLVSKKMDFSRLYVQLSPLSFIDLLKKHKREILKDRVFLNPKYKNNQKYLDLIFEMQKLAFWQNLSFYLKMFFKDAGLIKRILTVR